MLNNSYSKIFSLAHDINQEIKILSISTNEGVDNLGQTVIDSSIVEGTRDYIERVVKQINGTYENGYYDATAVLMRRLLETVIIEAYEANSIESKIKDQDDNYFYLKKLITQVLKEKIFNLSRNTKNALPELKKIGDLSAHNRRYNARFHDIENIRVSFRTAIEEFIYVAGLVKK